MSKNRFYSLMRGIVKPVAALIFPTRVTGAEHIPDEGAVLLCCNHISMLDPVLMICFLRRPVRFLAKKELFDSKIGNWFFRKMGMVPVDRGAGDLAAMRTCLEVLNEGGALGVFPQGHRFHQDESHEIQSGAGMMALRSRAAVVPVHISAPMRPFHRIYMNVRAPIDISDLTRPNSQAIETITHRIAGGIWQEENQ